MLTLAALTIGFLLCALPARWIMVHERAAVEGERARLSAHLERANERIAGLEAMLDEIRARETHTTAPATATVAPAEAPLPDEVRRELDAIEDEEGRAELAQLARLAMQARPEASAHEIVREVFGG